MERAKGAVDEAELDASARGHATGKRKRDGSAAEGAAEDATFCTPLHDISDGCIGRNDTEEVDLNESFRSRGSAASGLSSAPGTPPMPSPTLRRYDSHHGRNDCPHHPFNTGTNER